MVNFTLPLRRTRWIQFFPFLSSNIPSWPVYDVFISQLKRHSRACSLSMNVLFPKPGVLPWYASQTGIHLGMLEIVIRDVLWSVRGSLIPQYEVYLPEMFLRNTNNRRRARFAIHLLDSKDAKNLYKHRIIAGSSKCSTKPLSILLTKLVTHIKQGLQKYCETSY